MFELIIWFDLANRIENRNKNAFGSLGLGYLESEKLKIKCLSGTFVTIFWGAFCSVITFSLVALVLVFSLLLFWWNWEVSLLLKCWLIGWLFIRIEANLWGLEISFQIPWKSGPSFILFPISLSLLYFSTIFSMFGTKLNYKRYLLRGFSGNIDHFVSHVILRFHDFYHWFEEYVRKANVVTKPSACFGQLFFERESSHSHSGDGSCNEKQYFSQSHSSSKIYNFYTKFVIIKGVFN